MNTTDSATISQDSGIIVRIPPGQVGNRLDKVLTELFPDFSRSRLQQWLKEGVIRLDGHVRPAKYKVMGTEEISIKIDPQKQESPHVEAEDIPLNIVFADDDLIVIDKSPGMVVHPAAGNWVGTLQNALLHHFPELQSLPRSGIVHRLDKDTSGLMVVARNLKAHKNLVEQLQNRSLSREYIAIVQGIVISGGTVSEPVGRHPVDRKRMSVRRGGKEAVTHYRVEQRFRAHTCLKVRLETGRTHQIRVHMSHIQKPIVGDSVYGGRLKIPKGAPEILVRALKAFKRQALHAVGLGLVHPHKNEKLQWTSLLPQDMQALIAVLSEHQEEKNEYGIS